jgi:Tol biopolymer transport system component
MFRTVLALTLLACLASAQQPPAGREGAARGGVTGRLTWFDRQGKPVGTIGEPGVYRTLTISPNGKRVAVEQNRDIWLLDATGGTPIHFTTDPAWEAFPVWSPDATRIVFTSNRSGTFDLYEKSVTGQTPETLFNKSGEGKGVTSWSPNGKFLLYYSIGQPTHLRLLPVDGPVDRAAIPVVDAQFQSITGRFSPDGRWILYTSNESAPSEVSVRSFNAATGAIGPPTVITHDGGRTPLWRGDGKEIFYFNNDGMVTAMEVNASGTTFQPGTPKPLFKAPSGVLFWDVTPDGQRFLMPQAGS